MTPTPHISKEDVEKIIEVLAIKKKCPEPCDLSHPVLIGDVMEKMAEEMILTNKNLIELVDLWIPLLPSTSLQQIIEESGWEAKRLRDCSPLCKKPHNHGVYSANMDDAVLKCPKARALFEFLKPIILQP